MAGYIMGMPGYKEPEEKVEESEEEFPLGNKWANTGKTWEKINQKPAIRHVDSIREKENKEDEPFKINLRKVGDRNKVKKEKEKS